MSEEVDFGTVSIPKYLVSMTKKLRKVREKILYMLSFFGD
jgi:hypothetical protein